MSTKLLGVDIYRVTTNPLHELGLIVEDVRGGEQNITSQDFLAPAGGTNTGANYTAITTVRRYSPDGTYKYVRNVDGTNPVASGDAVTITSTTDFSGEPGLIVRAASTTTHPLEGIAIVDIPANSFGFIQIRGRVPTGVSSTNTNERLGAKVASTNVVALDYLEPSATAGILQELAAGTGSTVNTIVGRKARAILASADLDPGTNTDIRAEIVIY